MLKIVVGIQLLILAAAGVASASEPQYLIQTSGSDNLAEIHITGSENRLEIVQDFLGAGGGNQVAVTIDGHRNGGPLARSFSGAALASGLLPGTLQQTGHDNHIVADVNGSDNLFAFVQSGGHNSLTASITGSYNQAVVSQTGTGNITNFSQTGTGNMLSVTQRSW